MASASKIEMRWSALQKQFYSWCHHFHIHPDFFLCSVCAWKMCKGIQKSGVPRTSLSGFHVIQHPEGIREDWRGELTFMGGGQLLIIMIVQRMHAYSHVISWMQFSCAFKIYCDKVLSRMEVSLGIHNSEYFLTNLFGLAFAALYFNFSFSVSIPS